jgi:hypothetical protein
MAREITLNEARVESLSPSLGKIFLDLSFPLKPAI